jgi:hypothetical protein
MSQTSSLPRVSGEDMNLDREIYEGWTARDFIEELRPQFDMIMAGRSWQVAFTSKAEIKSWCADNQPHYKNSVPEVVSYFWQLAKVEQSG